MGKHSLLKKLVSFATALMVILMPVSAMAAEGNQESAIVENEASVMPRSYVETIDRDISIYIPEKNDTFSCHIKAVYEYSDGNWVTFRGTPRITNEHTSTGTATLDDEPKITSAGVAVFSGIASTHGEAIYITFKLVVDIYGDVYYSVTTP